jgi:hypothetical protein
MIIANSCGVKIVKINMEEVKPLKIRAVPMDDEGNYVVTLDVFHQLHCLVRLSFLDIHIYNLSPTNSTSKQNASKDLMEPHKLW